MPSREVRELLCGVKRPREAGVLDVDVVATAHRVFEKEKGTEGGRLYFFARDVRCIDGPEQTNMAHLYTSLGLQHSIRRRMAFLYRVNGHSLHEIRDAVHFLDRVCEHAARAL